MKISNSKPLQLFQNAGCYNKCCPLFKRTIGANCKCYNYAEDLDSQALITLQSYCDINNPCKSVQVSSSFFVLQIEKLLIGSVLPFWWTWILYKAKIEVIART